MPVVRAEDVEVGEEEDSEPRPGATTETEETEDTNADDGGDELEEGTPHPDVETIVFFPDYKEKKFIIGEPITVLVGFSNKGDKTFDVSVLGAQLHSPYDLKYFIQNFTRKYVTVRSDPHSQVTLEYKFTPDKNLEPIDIWLSASVDYNATEDHFYRTTFLNGTVELIEKSSDVNLQRFFTVVLLLTVVGLVSYVAFGMKDSPAKAKSRSDSSEPGTRATTNDEWGNIYKPKPEVEKPKRSKKKDQ